MAKVYEFAFARVTFDNPNNKVQSIINNADKFSSLGWEFKGHFDAVSEVYLFYQREKDMGVPPQVIQTPAINLPTTTTT